MQKTYSGYEVAPDGTYVQLDDGGLERVDIRFGYWVGLKTNTRAGKNAKYVGIWTAKDGEKFVDPSRWVEDKAEALKLADFHEQIAIWDCQNGAEIYV